AARREARRSAGGGRGAAGPGGLGGFGGFGPGGQRTAAAGVADGPVRAETDKVMDELRSLLQARQQAGTDQGEVTVRWAYEILAPAAAGAVLLAVLTGIG
ncbi:PH domain-containing protein, partial [Streptomyces sp. TRM76130]|nr:PH domain-containing protein [Streptomyces sp. TRM76130]